MRTYTLCALCQTDIPAPLGIVTDAGTFCSPACRDEFERDAHGDVRSAAQSGPASDAQGDGGEPDAYDYADAYDYGFED